MRRAILVLLAGLALAGRAEAQAISAAPKNGVIKPETNVDPGMKVLPPKTRTTMPVVHPPGSPRHDRQRRTIVVPK